MIIIDDNNKDKKNRSNEANEIVSFADIAKYRNNTIRNNPQLVVVKKDNSQRKIEYKNPITRLTNKVINTKLETKKKNSLGHRKRVINRFKEGGITALQDNEILEMILFYTIKYYDTKEIAYELLNEFGSLEKVFSESYERILSVINRNNCPTEEERKNSALLIKFIRNLAVILWDRGTKNKLKEKLANKIISGSQLLEYLKEYYNNYLETDMRDLSEEQFRVIFLDSNNKIIKDQVMFRGTINQTGVYPRQILKRALELNSVSIIAVHNHPAGTLKPSNADINVTRNLQSACDSLGIQLLDHLIIGDRFYNDEDNQKNFYSFAENGLI